MTAQPAPAPVRSVTPDGPPVHFDDFAPLADAWAEMPEARRHREIVTYVGTLSVLRRREVTALAGFLVKLVDNQIADHEAQEDEAWGGFIEDRLVYGLARLRTGHSDPRWVQQHAPSRRARRRSGGW